MLTGDVVDGLAGVNQGIRGFEWRQGASNDFVLDRSLLS